MPASDTSSPPVPRKTKDLTIMLPDKNQIKKLSREELEDKYLTTCEENVKLKLRVNEQEEQLKKHQRSRNQLANKLLKMTKDQTDAGSTTREGQVDTTELYNYVFELEQQNMLLRDKLKSAKYQLSAYTRFPLAPGPGQRYTSSTSGRTSRGTLKPSPAFIPISPAAKVEMISPNVPVENILLRQAEETIGKQRQQISMYEAEIDALRQQVQLKQVAFDDELSRLQSQITSEQRSMTTENIEIIRMQKIVRDQANEISVLQVRCNKHEMELRNYKTQHQTALMEIDQLKAKLHAEQTINLQLQTELRSMRSNHDGTVLKLTQEVDTLKRENDILKDANDRVLANAFNVERDKQWEITERSLRTQLATLEAAVKADAITRNEILEKLANEIASKDELEQQLRKLEVQNVQLKADAEQIRTKLNKLTTAQGVEYGEIEEAIAFIRQKKKTGENIDLKMPDFITQLPPDADANQDAKEKLTNLQLNFAETVQELEKTRNMLLIQYKINQDFKIETDEVRQRSEMLKDEYERKLKQYAKLLDERALRIQKLERQLYDLAYGTRGAQPPAKKPEVDMAMLEPGRNILELHLSELKLTDEALRRMQSPDPNTFLTIEFYDFEIQFTPMLTGARSLMDFTCQYNVVINDLFLHYMQTECAHIELHQAIGSHYKTWAAGRIYLKDLIDHQEGKIFGTAQLSGIDSEALAIPFGELKFSLQLQVPAEKALKFYKERVKSLGYIVENGGAPLAIQNKTNQLHIQIYRCRDLKSKTGDDPPSVYIGYHFYDLPDHDTKVASPNTNPELNDHATWPVNLDQDLDRYLRQQALRIYVFDDSAPNDSMSYLGHADIPLLPLAHNKPISGTFSLMSGDGMGKGSIDVSLNWQHAYIAPMDTFSIAEPTLPLPPPIEITGPAPISIEAQKTPVTKRRPPVLPEPPELQIQPKEDQIVVRIDHDTSRDMKIDTGDQEEIKIDTTDQGVKTKPQLRRSETFDKIKDESDQPQKPPRKTWDKPPTAPRRSKNANGLVSPGKDIPQEHDVDDSSPGQDTDSEIVIGSVLKPETWPEIIIDIHSMHLPEHSLLLKQEHLNLIFLEWSFLDLQRDECETVSFEKPHVPLESVDIKYHKVIPTNANRIILFKSMLSSGENITLNLVSDPGDEGDCVDLGNAIIDLQAIQENNQDLDHAAINVISSEGRILAVLKISLKIIEAIHKTKKI